MRNRETEVKIPIADLKATRRKLHKLGLRAAHARALEDNILFDTPDRALRQVRSILRLRRYASRWWLTHKGTPDTSGGYKTRVELETEVDNPEAIRGILQALGLQPVFRYQKYRSHYVPAGAKQRRKPSLEVTVDETPIGNFLELEGSPSRIDRTARQLGYSSDDYSTASYGALYLEECRKRNLPPGDMVFAKRSGRRKSHRATEAGR